MKNQSEVLREKIALLQSQQTANFSELKSHFHLTYDSLKPLTLLKSTLKEVTASPELKDGLLSNVIGFASGYISKKILLGTAHNPITRGLGNMLQFTVGSFIANNSETIKAVGEVVLSKVFDRISNVNHVSLEKSISISVDEQMKDY